MCIRDRDEDILVINKPADMPVHPSAGNYENTLANGIAWYFAEKGEILHFPVDNYYYEGKRTAVFLGEKVTKYHRTLTLSLIHI